MQYQYSAFACLCDQTMFTLFESYNWYTDIVDYIISQIYNRCEVRKSLAHFIVFYWLGENVERCTIGSKKGKISNFLIRKKNFFFS